MNCRVVLVRTEFAGNVGSAARLVRNFGASELVLVAPQADPRSRDARRMAASATTHQDDCQGAEANG